MKIHSFIKQSFVNGPGKNGRFVLWTQGCIHNCKGCYNPETWDKTKGIEIATSNLAEIILNSGSTGLTISGGDPFLQPEELLNLLILLDNNLKDGIIVFTGYLYENLISDEISKKCIDYIDLLIDGPYIEDKRSYNGLYGSSNQRLFFNNKIGMGTYKIDESKIIFDQDIEVHIINNNMCVTGFPELNVHAKKYLKNQGIEIIY